MCVQRCVQLSSCVFLTLLSASLCTNDTFSTARNRSETDAVALLDQLYKIDSRLRPGVFGPPTIVLIDFYVQSFGPLDEIEMQFSVDLDFRQTWTDSRLTFVSETDSPVYIPAQDVNRFWIPDIYFPNEKHGSSHDITIPNKSLRIYRNGTIRYFSRMAMSLSCTMDLKTFPLDRQICEIKISTYSYDSQEIGLQWFDEDPIEIKLDELNLPQFQLEDFNSGLCNETYKTGDFSCLKAVFHLKRKIGFFVLQTYVPSMLIVMLSWVGFWINKNSEPARVALGVTTVLTMTTQLTSSRSTMMRVSYLKAIDVWYSTCMMFVFGALIEYAFVNVSVRNEKKLSEVRQDPENPISNDALCKERTQWLRPVTDSLKLLTNQISSKGIDQMSRRLFPAVFLIFNIIYWIVYALI